MKNLWLDIGNTRLKYWITDNHQIIQHAAEMHLQSPADLLLGLIHHFKDLNLNNVGVSAVQDQKNNDRIQRILKPLNVPLGPKVNLAIASVFNIASDRSVMSMLFGSTLKSPIKITG